MLGWEESKSSAEEFARRGGERTGKSGVRCWSNEPERVGDAGIALNENVGVPPTGEVGLLGPGERGAMIPSFCTRLLEREK